MKTPYKIALIAAAAILLLTVFTSLRPDTEGRALSDGDTTQPVTRVHDQRPSLVHSAGNPTDDAESAGTNTPESATVNPNEKTETQANTNHQAELNTASNIARKETTAPRATSPVVPATPLTNTDYSQSLRTTSPPDTATNQKPGVSLNALNAILGHPSDSVSESPEEETSDHDRSDHTDHRAASAAMIYTVQPGDTFSKIAARHYGDESRWFDIAQANPTVDPTRLRVGQTLKLPSPDSLKKHDEPIPPAPGSVQTYTIRPGDSLSTVAQKFYGDPTLWRVIYNFNRDKIGDNPNAIQAGMVLKVPPRVRGAD
ncbi:MAG: hypothetical protein Kow00105_05960 [Phycisphaeraceae bacterium]